METIKVMDGYVLIRSRKRRRTMSLQIMPGGKVVIRAPYRTPQEEIDRFLKARSGWVEKKLLEREAWPQTDDRAKRFTPGEKFLYLGEWYPLDIEGRNGRKAPLVLMWSRFILDEGRSGEAEALFVRWYREEAKRLLTDRVGHYSRKLGLFPKGITITGAQYRYGSCSPANSLSFAWRLIMAPLAVIDYIIVHELIHIKEKNHSKRFWNGVASAMPGYKDHRAWLKNNNHLLQM